MILIPLLRVWGSGLCKRLVTFAANITNACSH